MENFYQLYKVKRVLKNQHQVQYCCEIISVDHKKTEYAENSMENLALRLYQQFQIHSPKKILYQNYLKQEIVFSNNVVSIKVGLSVSELEELALNLSTKYNLSTKQLH